MDLQKYSKSLLDTNQSITATEHIDQSWLFIWKQSQKIAEICCEEDIICTSTKSIYLLTRLVFSLSTNTYFSGSVSIITLESPSFLQSSENAKIAQNSVDNKQGRKIHRLRFSYSIKGMQKVQARAFFKLDVQKKKSECQFIFHKITEILDSYRVQNRLSFWVTRLNTDLKNYLQFRFPHD